MTTEERLKRIEERVGMNWSCWNMVDQFAPAPKQASIRIGPMHPRRAEQIYGVLEEVNGIRVETAVTHDPNDVCFTKHTLTITGPAVQ